MKLFRYIAGAFFLLAAYVVNASEPQNVDVIAWGANPSINSPSVKVSAFRVGCADLLVDCLLRAIRGHDSKTKISLSIPPTVSTDAAIAAFDSLGRSTISGNVLEVGIDDFAAFGKRDLQSRSSITSTHSPDLRTSKILRDGGFPLALTVYEDELDALAKISDPHLVYLMKSAKRIAFYLHFRKSVDSYRSYFPKLMELFPNARVYGGIYHYDRSDYIACSMISNTKCSVGEDSELYAKLLNAIKEGLQSGMISGVELYPGIIGHEATWTGWKNPRICSPQRVKECIATTQKMGAMFIDKFGN